MSDLGKYIKQRNRELLDKYQDLTYNIGNNMSEAQAQSVPAITVDGKDYPIDALPPDVQELVGYYQNWQAEHERQKLEAFKTEAAMRALSAEIQNRVRSMVQAALDSMAAQESANDVGPADATEEVSMQEESPTVQ